MIDYKTLIRSRQTVEEYGCYTIYLSRHLFTWYLWADMTGQDDFVDFCTRYSKKDSLKQIDALKKHLDKRIAKKVAEQI